MAESTISGSKVDGGGFRIRPLTLIIAAVVLIVIVGGAFLVITNIDSIVAGINNVLTWIFSPNARVNAADIVICKNDSGCSTTHAFLYSAILLFVVITGFAYTTLLERKFIAWFQHRVGPNRVGPMGFLQPLADAIKLITKEDITPSGASWGVWFISPMIKAVPVLVVLAVIPLGPDLLVPWFDGKWYQVPLYLADPSVGVLWLLGITSIGTYGIVLAGWSSNNKYAMLGGLRASAQMISYELTLGLGMAVPVMIVGSMALGDIAKNQTMFWDWFILQNPLAAVILFIALLAEVSRSPFDLVEAEQELTAGFMTEYSGMKFALFMMAEYLGMIAISLIFATLYLGGYQDGFGLVNSIPILGPLVLIGKVVLLLIFMVWIRATLPRIRYDKLMQFGWKVLLPLALVAVVWTAIAVVLGDAFQNTLGYGVASGILLVIFLVVAYMYVQRLSKTEGEAEVGDELAADPVVTGERRGFGWGVLSVVGAVLAVPFSLLNLLIDQLDKIAATGNIQKPDTKALAIKENPSTAAARKYVESAKASVKQVAAPAAQPALTAEASSAPAAAKAPAAPAKTAPAAGGAKPKFDKEAMLAKIREKKENKG